MRKFPVFWVDFMRVIFLGEGRLAFTCLNILLQREFSKVFKLNTLVSSETFYSNLVKSYSFQNNLNFVSNNSRSEDQIVELIEREKINTLISVQHKWIMSKKILNKFGCNAFNFHNAKLPEYKGYNSLSHSILNGDSKHFMTIHRVDPKVDAGDIVLESSITISKDETALSLYKKTISGTEDLFSNFLKKFNQNTLEGKSQKGESKFFKKSSLTKLRELDLKADKSYLNRVIRALYFPPYEPAYFILNDQKVYCLPNNKENSWLNVKPANKSDWDLKSSNNFEF